MRKFDILIIDPDHNSRMRLRSAAAHVGLFGTVTHAPTMQRGISTLETQEAYVIVFVSSELNQELAQEFITLGKKTRCGQDSAYILVLRQDDTKAAAVSDSVLKGYDGVLLEPFSAEALVEVSNLAVSVYKQRKAEREESAVKLLCKDITSTLDMIAYAKASNQAPGEAIRTLKHLGESVRDLEKHLEVLYFKYLAEQCEKAQPFLITKKNQTKTKESAMDRLRKKMEAYGIDSDDFEK